MSVLVVGSVAFDAVETPHGKVDRMIGGSGTYFAVAASYFAPVKLVAVVGDDFIAKDAAIFRGRSIDTEGLERAPGKTFFWSGRYSLDMNDRITLVTDLNVFGEFKPRLPESYCKTPFLFLANIHPALQLNVLRQMARQPKLVALDTMNYWIERAPDELQAVLREIDILVINDTEVRQLSGEHNLLRAAARIQQMGPKILVVKCGEHGAMLIQKDSLFSVPGLPLAKVYDPTGAGDSFAGGFMGWLTQAGKVNDGTLRTAMVYGSVMGSFAVERFGLERLRRLKRPEIAARARQFQRLTQFSL